MTRTWVCALAGLIAASPVQAAEISFRATAIQQAPDQTAQTARIFKSGSNMRLEFTRQGQPVVQIMQPTKGIMRILYPQQKTYMEFPTPVASGQPLAKPDNPCARAQGANCNLAGTVPFSGLQVEKWVLIPKGKKPTTILWDPTRKMAVQQDFPDGRQVMMAYLGAATHEGRNVEHWKTTMTAPKAEPRTGQWWYDPKLETIVREEGENGGKRSFTDIKVGAIDPSYFAAPQGYRRVEMPRQPQQQPQGQYRQPSAPQGQYLQRPPPTRYGQGGYQQPYRQPPPGYGQPPRYPQPPQRQ